MFQVTTPASSLVLLTAAELRAAIGIVDTDHSQDAVLATVEKQATALIVTECSVASDGLHPPTLLSETVKDTIWLTRGMDQVKLSRQFVSSVTSIVEDDVTLALTTDYVLDDPEGGFVVRIRDGRPSRWGCSQIVVTYVAGFSTIPDDLKAACSELVHTKWFALSRDPLVKMQWAEVPGIMAKKEEFWVGGVPQTGSAGPVSETVSGLLVRFRTYNV